MHLDVDFWIDRTDQPDDVLADHAAIASLVDNAFRDDPHMFDLADYPDTVAGADIRARIESISKPYATDLFFRDGGLVTTADYERYTLNLNLDRIGDTASVRFGIVLRRTSMRAWPTRDVVFKSPETFDLDRFQENGLFPTDVVAILHESADGVWFFVQSYNYAAWVRQDNIVEGEREEILTYRDTDSCLVIAGSKATTNFNPSVDSISELQLDMGVRVPLLPSDQIEHHVDGQNTQSSYAVSLPARDQRGELEFRKALIARNQDVSIGNMPFTRRNVLHQAFKFLGERYGWGHSYNARDCSGLVIEVYKTFGILLPRNTLQQRESPIGRNTPIAADASAAEKLKILEAADVGDLLYSPGHVMLYLGQIDGEPYVIHSLFGAGWTDEEGRFQEGVLNGVSVTPIRDIYVSPQETYFDQLCSVKQIR